MKYLLAALAFISCNGSKVHELQKKIDAYEAAEKVTAERLIRMDSLDFQFYSNQLWDSLSLSHTDDIKVFYPDGTTSQGLFPAHIDLLKPQFVFAPDTKVTAHPIRFGTGEWTCVVGIVEGTFSNVMPAGGDKTIAPTGKRFKFPMVTIGHWEGGKMKEEYLFFDNLGILKQIGLAQ
ncbi:ester cyclase [Chitinophaga niabensis]|uniref:SnoaL-like polyketide cyclase n=1 Tax=Chitinophaga niabensis TaxID=536979 RepID=A0A1N6D1N7_9BACT|nr:ester cyclase [Chitinophaga niabensis]SIN64708.1 SnoaL-like polyketide cyclase [Chitinophaga niabensis]